MDLINQAIAAVLSIINGPAIAAIAVVLEIVLRIIPSEAPKSLLLGASAICKSIAKLAEAIATGLDKLIPQRLK